MWTPRRAVGIALLLGAPAVPWLAGLAACSSDDPASGYAGDAEAETTSSAVPEGSVFVSEDAPAMIFGDDANPPSDDGGASGLCPGVALPEDAMSPACAIDTSASCPTCASWGFVCASWASPILQDASAATFCRGIPIDGGGALVCCTQPACVVTTVAGPCDASTQTRYDCSGGAVPNGACAWLGASAPNDYCCQ